MAALERRLGPAGAARLVNEFYKVARDVAFKHDALLDIPRLPADGKDVPIADLNQPTTGTGGEAMLRVVIGLPIAGEDDAGRAIKLALALVDTLDGIGSDVEPELRLALAVQRGVALVKKAGEKKELSFDIEESTAAFANKLARQARGAEILVGGRVFRAARSEWNFEALPAIDLPDDRPPGLPLQSRATRTPTRASSARACTACADRRSVRSGCASVAKIAACTAASSSSRRCAMRGATCSSRSASGRSSSSVMPASASAPSCARSSRASTRGKRSSSGRAGVSELQ
jgi:class 3 adenylate cyclase